MIQLKHFFIFLFIWSFTFSLNAQNEHGLLPMRVYGTSDYGGQQQVFYVKSDSRGVIYASNRNGLMELSGNSWKIYKIREEVQVRTIDIDALGRIFVGGDGEFGYFDIDSNQNGILTYYSISEQLEKQEKDIKFGSINSIVCKQGIAYFQSKNYLFVWDNDSLITINSKNKFFELFAINDNVFIPIRSEGYFLINHDTLINVYKTNSLGIAIYTAPYINGQILSFNQKYGLRTLSYQNEEIRFGRRIHSFFDYQKDIKVSDLLQINANTYSISSNRGVFIINEKGKLIRAITKQQGLKSNIVTNQSVDINKTLWVGTENGLAKINILSNSEFFPPKKCNYSGRIEDINRFNGLIHIITPSGLYRLDENVNDLNTQIKNFSSFNEKSLSGFTQIKPKGTAKKQALNDSLKNELVNPCWDLESFSLNNKKLLLISSNNLLIWMDSTDKIGKVTNCYPYCSYQSKVNPRRVFIGLDGGFQSVYYTKSGKWIDEGLVDGVSAVVLDIEEDKDGNIWLSTNTQGVIYIEKPKFTKHQISKPHILNIQKGLITVDPLRILTLDNKLLFASSVGIYDFSWKDTSFALNPQLNSKPENLDLFIHRLSKDREQNLWDVIVDGKTKIATVNYIRKNKDGSYDSQSIFAKKDEIVNSFEHDNDGITWYGGTFGLSKTTSSTPTFNKPKYYTYLSTILNNSDTAFGGFYQTEEGSSNTQPKSFVKTYSFSHNSFTFYFSSSSPSDYSKLSFSWYLEGYEHELSWGQWANNSYKEYTNLNEGHYIFHVRAVDVYGNLSEEATYEFTIKPPWYRTIWAYLGLFIFFVSFVWIAIRVSTRGLKKIIKAATAEIMEQKDLLEEKNRNIIDSIRYAQRIQEAVIPSSNRFHKHFHDSFILWKPRDIVSGDFYWLSQRNHQIFVAAADCTGHGVPGAFMSIMGISFLNQIVAMPEVVNAADTLNHLRSNVITALNKEQSDTANKDGMDIALCVFDFEKKQVEYAGAYNSLYVFRDGELLETKADRMPIGVHDRDSIPFKNNIVDLKSGDQLYMFSDGYIDQFGGPKGKKFMTKRFKKLLLEITHLSMSEQKEILWKNILDWRGEIEQVDDIIILGIRID